MLVSLQTFFCGLKYTCQSYSHFISEFRFFGVLVDQFYFVFLCIVHSHLQTGGLTNGYYLANQARKSNGLSIVP